MVQDTAWEIRKRQAVADHAMVAAMHPLAAEAGLSILRNGGNAVDAAVATAFVVGVVEPFMSGLGGVCCMVIYNRAEDQITVIDGNSVAPAKASDNMYELLASTEKAGMYGWRATKNDAQNTGYRAACVPGTPAALLLAHERFGILSRSQILEPAIRLAKEGFGLDRHVASTIAFAAARLRSFPGTMKVLFRPDGNPHLPDVAGEPPDPLIQPELAATMQLLANEGAEAFYQGEIADRIARFMMEHGGLISREDLANYSPRIHTEGLESTYRDIRLVGVPGVSGSITAFQILNILECFDLREAGVGTCEMYHLIAEASRRAFLDRFAHITDPASQAVPWEGLMSKAYAEILAKQIDPHRATPDTTAGNPWIYQSGTKPDGMPSTHSGGDGCTTHIAVIDGQRNAVSLTSTLGVEFGSGVIVDGTGVLLNNGMTWFDPEPGHVNSIAPNKRVLFAPAPTLGFKGDRLLIAVGAPGGRKIISAVPQTLINVVEFGMGIQEAVSYPRVHSEGRLTMVNQRSGGHVAEGLRNFGHIIEVREESVSTMPFARPIGIMVAPDGKLTGGVNQFVAAWACGI